MARLFFQTAHKFVLSLINKGVILKQLPQNLTQMSDLKNFMMIFRFEPNNEYQPTQEERAQQRQQWGTFIGNLAIAEKLVGTNQLGFNGKQLHADHSVSEGVNISEGQMMGGNMIVKANTIDEAIEMAKDCPILNMGGTVEVRDILPM